MKVVHLSAGAGPMYCGSCLHSNTLAAALGKLGVDLLLVPLYTPLRTDEENVSDDRLAMGGINVYLQHRWSLLGRLPRFLQRLLDRPALVRWAARRGAQTRPERLGPLTVSVLRGHEGRVRKEVEKLSAWLAADVRPDVVHLSNVMLAGLAPALRARLSVPIVCTLSGEDSFLEKLPPPHGAEARAVLRQRAAELDALIAMNGYYARFMADYLAVPAERIHVIPPGLLLDGHRKPAFPLPPGEGPRVRAAEGAPPSAFPKTIGFLGRICPDKGLHLLVEALRLLAADPSVPPFRVRAAGYLEPADRPYLSGLLARLAGCGLADRFEYLGELDRPAKIAFLQSLDVMTAPSVYPESKGLPVLEAWANGVPVVLPAHGAFPEMVEDTGGGLLFEPQNVPALAAALARMLREDQLAADCGRRAQQAVHERYSAERMARQTLELYESILKRSREPFTQSR
jgi:glycosyltransferase involved in cell wall biosynthesis